MSEIKSSSTFKKEELFDQLLSFIEEQIWGSSKEQSYRDLPLYLTLGDTWGERKGCKLPPQEILSFQEILHLTRPRRRGDIPRLVHLGSCREWAMFPENWARMIPEAKELLLECAREHNDIEFLERVKVFAKF